MPGAFPGGYGAPQTAGGYGDLQTAGGYEAQGNSRLATSTASFEELEFRGEAQDEFLDGMYEDASGVFSVDC